MRLGMLVEISAGNGMGFDLPEWEYGRECPVRQLVSVSALPIPGSLSVEVGGRGERDQQG